MTGNNVLSLVMSIIVYAFLGYLVITLFIGVFPILAILLVLGLIIYAVFSMVNRFRAGVGQAQAKKKFDEYGNRRTKATLVGMEEASPETPPADTGKKDKQE
jgi:hypothetical protein